VLYIIWNSRYLLTEEGRCEARRDIEGKIENIITSEKSAVPSYSVQAFGNDKWRRAPYFHPDEEVDYGLLFKF